MRIRVQCAVLAVAVGVILSGCGGGGADDDLGDAREESPAYLLGLAQGKQAHDSPVSMVPEPASELEACESMWTYGGGQGQPEDWHDDWIRGCLDGGTRYEK
jgi:hypothetical protein